MHVDVGSNPGVNAGHWHILGYECVVCGDILGMPSHGTLRITAYSRDGLIGILNIAKTLLVVVVLQNSLKR